MIGLVILSMRLFAMCRVMSLSEFSSRLLVPDMDSCLLACNYSHCHLAVNLQVLMTVLLLGQSHSLTLCSPCFS